MYVVRDSSLTVEPTRLLIRNTTVAAALLHPKLATLAVERFYVLALNARNELLGLRMVAQGGSGSCSVDPREVFRFAILKRAAALILAHNHPSGDPRPSREDYALTEQLTAAGRLLSIRVLDHVVIGRGSSPLNYRTCSAEC